MEVVDKKEVKPHRSTPMQADSYKEEDPETMGDDPKELTPGFTSV